jgi:hypothetical protein
MKKRTIRILPSLQFLLFVAIAFFSSQLILAKYNPAYTHNSSLNTLEMYEQRKLQKINNARSFLQDGFNYIKVGNEYLNLLVYCYTKLNFENSSEILECAKIVLQQADKNFHYARRYFDPENELSKQYENRAVIGVKQQGYGMAYLGLAYTIYFRDIIGINKNTYINKIIMDTAIDSFARSFDSLKPNCVNSQIYDEYILNCSKFVKILNTAIIATINKSKSPVLITYQQFKKNWFKFNSSGK